MVHLLTLLAMELSLSVFLLGDAAEKANNHCPVPRRCAILEKLNMELFVEMPTCSSPTCPSSYHRRSSEEHPN
jgi:hypothetical protein